MAKIAPAYKDSIVFDSLANYPTAALVWYLMSGYAKFGKSQPILSDAAYNRLEAALQSGWDKIPDYHNCKLGKTFEDVRMSFVFNFDKLPNVVKASAMGHIKDVYSGIEREPREITPPVSSSVPVVVEDNKSVEEQKPSPKIEHPRIRMEARIYLDALHDKEKEVKEICKKYCFEPVFQNDYRSLGSSSPYSKPLILARCMQVIHKVKELGLTVLDYKVSEVIIDSTVKDVWNVRKK